jgi:5-methyltetrahydropteroyltriglutamate--homocysteine methyltransferase
MGGDEFVVLLEDVEDPSEAVWVAERITNYAERVGKENVIAGADCGFAQGVGVSRVHPQIVWEKFRMLADGARLATQRLYR